jgi:hypothetical protein
MVFSICHHRDSPPIESFFGQSAGSDRPVRLKLGDERPVGFRNIPNKGPGRRSSDGSRLTLGPLPKRTLRAAFRLASNPGALRSRYVLFAWRVLVRAGTALAELQANQDTERTKNYSQMRRGEQSPLDYRITHRRSSLIGDGASAERQPGQSAQSPTRRQSDHRRTRYDP